MQSIQHRIERAWPRDADEGAPARSIIHVGFHKTATTWFQRHVYPAARSHCFIDRRKLRSVILGTPAMTFDAGAARRELGLEKADTPFILCDEDLSGVLHNGGPGARFAAKAVAQRLHALAPDAQIVIMVRAQPALAASTYQQYVREGGTASPLRYLFPEEYRHLGYARPLKAARFDFASMDHHLLIDLYDQLFGRTNVHVFAYEAFAADPTAFLREFRARLGYDMEGEPAVRERVNGSYRRGLLPLARFLNLFTERQVADKRVLVHIPYWYGLRKRLLRRLNRLPIFGRPPNAQTLFGREAVRWIEARFVEGNQLLAKRMAQDLAALGYPMRKPMAPIIKPTMPAWRAWTRN